MAYRQPRLPEYRKSEGVSAYLKLLILFLKDFTTAAWTANNQRIREMAALEARVKRMEEAARTGEETEDA